MRSDESVLESGVGGSTPHAPRGIPYPGTANTGAPPAAIARAASEVARCGATSLG